MANAFRSAFFVTAILTLITLPAVFVGFFPLTLIMALISLVCLILWKTMLQAYTDSNQQAKTTAATYAPPIDQSKIVVGDEKLDKTEHDH